MFKRVLRKLEIIDMLEEKGINKGDNFNYAAILFGNLIGAALH